MQKNKSNEYVVKVTATTTQEILQRDYDDNIKLNKDFANYLLFKTYKINSKQTLKLHFNMNQKIAKSEIETALNNQFIQESNIIKEEIKNLNFFILIMFYLGIITFFFMGTIHNYEYSNFYIETILEITAWVFVWESVDAFFLQRPKLKQKFLQMKKLCKADIKI
ncbi:MAG: hypothetical protein E7376_03430 [Clostridiales bacterium]|nr:hypothetical protein [Clostridiales bacterium]